MEKKLPVIAIDGPSASGKGTMARGLARELGFAYLETGLIYRYVGLRWLKETSGQKPEDRNLDIAEKIAKEFVSNFSLDLLNDPSLRTNEAAEAASLIYPSTCIILRRLQREFAVNPPGGAKGAILDGRDIASVVCPDAAVKLFVTASPEIRAERRTKELQLMGQPATYEQVLEAVRVRDHRDQTREVAPLMPTAGSVTIDTSNLSAEDAIGIALRVIRRRLLPDE